ncbi:MAG: hypothetical protein ACYC2P_05895 [Paludibacteraceae bacterium]
MKSARKYILILMFAINIPFFLSAQGTLAVERTPEQEAVKQTEKMQKELYLTPEQAKSIYEINLKYARERKLSNKRSDAINRIKLKNEEIGKVLDNRQNNELQNKRSEVQSVEIDGKRRFTRTNPRLRNHVDPYSDKQFETVPRQFPDRPVRTDRSGQISSEIGERRALKQNDKSVDRSSDNNRNVKESAASSKNNRSSHSDSYRNAPVRGSKEKSSVIRPASGSRSVSPGRQPSRKR